MNDPAPEEHKHRSGAMARSPQDAAFLMKYDRIMRLPIILAAVLPLVMSPEPTGPVGIVVGIASWAVFLVDYVVHAQRLERYSHTWLGRFDLGVVILTSPWYLLPGASAGGLIVLLRLARLVRLVIVAQGAKRMFERLGRVALIAILVVVVAAAVAFQAEHPVNPEFATYWDSLWWGYVTLTTVGYGDITPITAVGRWSGVFIMTMGIGVLGVLAGSLSSFFRLTPKEAQQDAEEAARAKKYLGEPGEEDAAVLVDITAESTDIAALTAEVVDLRDEVRRLTAQIGRLAPDPRSGSPAHDRPGPSAGSSP